MQEQINPTEAMNNLFEFGKMLSKRRTIIGKSVKQIELECRVGGNNVSRWESGEMFPKKDRLPEIAKAYDIKLDELVKKWELSKEARESEKIARGTKGITRKVKTEEEMFPGHIGDKHTLGRTNAQVFNSRFGRK